MEISALAAIPPTQTCMNCHSSIYPDSPKLLALRESYATGLPVRWVRVHDLPDYAYFNHASHVNAGVGCASCHGNVAEMEKVTQQNAASAEESASASEELIAQADQMKGFVHELEALTGSDKKSVKKEQIKQKPVPTVVKPGQRPQPINVKQPAAGRALYPE